MFSPRPQTELIEEESLKSGGPEWIVCVCVQGKTVVQAEIDAAPELIDFFRFNAKHAIELESQQPLDAPGSTNTMLYRGLEVRTHTHTRLATASVCPGSCPTSFSWSSLSGFCGGCGSF